MQFQTPQFIEIEDKIWGPFSLRELLYLIAGGAVSLFAFYLFKFWLAAVTTALAASLSLSFALIRYNGQPFHRLVFSVFYYFWHPRFYLWQRQIQEKTIDIPEFSVLNKRKTLKELASEMPSVKQLWMQMMTAKNPIPAREKAVNIDRITDRFSLFRKLSGEREVARRIDYR